MPNEKTCFTETFVAAEDLTSGQYLGVTLTGDDRQVDQHDADTDIPCGVQLNEPDDGEECLVGVLGRFPVVAGEAIVMPSLLRFGANGRAYLFDPDVDTTSYCAGQFTKEASAAGEMAEAMINGINPWKGEE